MLQFPSMPLDDANWPLLTATGADALPSVEGIACATGLLDLLDVLAYGGTTLINFALLPLVLPGAFATGLLGVVSGVEWKLRGWQPLKSSEPIPGPGLVGWPFRLCYEGIWQVSVRLSRWWYAHRALRPLMLVPGWGVKAIAVVVLAVLPMAVAYPEKGTGKVAKKWALAYCDFPLSAQYVEAVRFLSRE